MDYTNSYRATFGVLVPSTNTVVEHDFNEIDPRGITIHASRIYIDEDNLESDDAFESVIGQTRESLPDAIRNIATCHPDYLLMGMSAETFWGGVERAEEFTDEVEERAGVGVAAGADAIREALDRIGAQRIAIVTPYQPIGDEHTEQYYVESGFEVSAIEGLACPSSAAIAETGRGELIDAIGRIDGQDVEAIVQVGTNLPMLELTAWTEDWLGKPVIAINAATMWYALRENGFDDQFDGYGTLLREY